MDLKAYLWYKDANEANLSLKKYGVAKKNEPVEIDAFPVALKTDESVAVVTIGNINCRPTHLRPDPNSVCIKPLPVISNLVGFVNATSYEAAVDVFLMFPPLERTVFLFLLGFDFFDLFWIFALDFVFCMKFYNRRDPVSKTLK
jgi:hypothetical protein